MRVTHHVRTNGLRDSAGVSSLADIDRELVRLRERLEAAIESAIALLDRLDAPAEDLEDEGDWEPWLGAPETTIAATIGDTSNVSRLCEAVL